MTHVMLDCYGANLYQLNDIKLINDLLTNLPYEIGLDAVSPPQLIPYYYGKVKEDIGVSGFVFLDGGHFTIHTFSMRECYFVDIFYKDTFDVKKVTKYLQEKLPYNVKESKIASTDRTENEFKILKYHTDIDFGPHLITKINSDTQLTMEMMFDFLENIVNDINMDPITRPIIVKNKINNSNYLSGIIVIAQSHIALHYNYDNKEICADIFSCAPFDYSTVTHIYERLGKIISNTLIPRGSKHIYKIKKSNDNYNIEASSNWQTVIRK